MKYSVPLLAHLQRTFCHRIISAIELPFIILYSVIYTCLLLLWVRVVYLLMHHLPHTVLSHLLPRLSTTFLSLKAFFHYFVYHIACLLSFSTAVKYEVLLPAYLPVIEYHYTPFITSSIEYNHILGEALTRSRPKWRTETILTNPIPHAFRRVQDALSYSF